MGVGMRKTEDHHHTLDQVQQYASAARDIGDALALSPEDRAALLPTLLTLIASKQVFYEQVNVGALGTILQPNAHR